MKTLLTFLLLPPEITEFERRYLHRVNRVALAFFAAHVPAFALIAWLNGTGPLLAVLLTTAVLAGPAIAVRTLSNPRAVSVVHGVAAMFFGGLLVHLGQGPVQIEMHFYFFSLLAMCAVFANPMVIIAAAVTVALHHLVVWLALPKSVFNYEAAWWVVAVHAAFVVVESVATCFIARSFFDNVIGLEKIVEARTAALDRRTRDMRTLLDNVAQGFLTIGGDGSMAEERSMAVDRWFGAPAPGETWFDYVGHASPTFADASRCAWLQVMDDVLPTEIALDLMPRRLRLGDAQLQFEYRPIGTPEAAKSYLVVVTDVTADVEREHAEIERKEAMEIFERVLGDRSGVESFFEEGSLIVETLTGKQSPDLVSAKRMLHTLKGNASLFGLGSVAGICHALEDFVAEERRLPVEATFAPLVERWARLASEIERLLRGRAHAIELDEADYAALQSAVQGKEPYAALLERVQRLRFEPVARRFAQFADQARQIAARLEKADLHVTIEDNGVRLDADGTSAFWSSFVHAIRNAVDHGIESPEARLAAHKPAEGKLVLRASQDDDRVVLEVVDDGRGIDWGAVRTRALERGLGAATPRELEAALFADGMSTAEKVTEVSGRGIGMGALAQGVRDLGGTLVVDSSGVGTTLRMTLPKQLPRPHHGLHALGATAIDRRREAGSLERLGTERDA
jgi:two-component system chemotaxis sensor kinase CheA